MATSAANCSYTIYNSSGGVAYTSASFSIPVGGSNFTYVPNISGLASGQYSAVISCDQQVAAVVNSSTNNSGASYTGVANPSTTWYAPNVYNNYYGFYTNFIIQNATSSPVTATLQVIDQNGNVVATQTASNIPAYAFAGLDQTGLGGLSANVNYSAKITATGNIAVQANIYGTGTYENQFYSYTPFTSGTTVAYAPVIMNNYYGYNTALTVQNLGDSNTTVTVTYGTGHTQTRTIAPSASYLFYSPSSGIPSGNTLGLTSAKIESSGQPIVALVNESNNYNRAGTYIAFASGATTVRAPIIMKRYYKYNTSVTCQNVGNSNTDITITYSNGAASSRNSIAPNGTALFYQPNETGLPDNFNGSATITSTSQPIVCVTNEDTNEGADGTTMWDHLFTYEGINQ